MSYYRYHVFFCTNLREDGTACCQRFDAQEHLAVQHAARFATDDRLLQQAEPMLRQRGLEQAVQ